MPNGTRLRERARQYHTEITVLAAATAGQTEHGLSSATALITAAADFTGLDVEGVPFGDPLLFGAIAYLDRASGCIWYCDALDKTPARKWFILAHEFAHYWLHPTLPSDAWQIGQDPDAVLAPVVTASAQTATGYSPAERRESEANLFALEFLLPVPVLRHLWLHENLPASQIVALSGVSETCVLSQLAFALLLGEDSGFRIQGSGEQTRDGSRGTEENAPPLTQAIPEPRTLNPEPYTLDSSQRAAAEIESGPVLVEAGPGTGKTRTLVARACHLLQERGLEPENLVALTFSNKAAEEMRSRLQIELGELADRIWIGTFHAFGLEILRKEGRNIGLPPAPRLIETVQAIALLEEHLDRLPLNHLENLAEPTQPFADILRCISRAKDELQTPDDYLAFAERQRMSATDVKTRERAEKHEEVAQVYAVYDALMRERGWLDFGDLLMRAVELLDVCPDVRERWQAQYPHILADEYQDINRASAQLVQRIAGNGAGLWAVGDLRQAIYRFRGASAANVRQFESDFPGGKRLHLDRNYRSLPSLVSLFSRTAQAVFVSENAAIEMASNDDETNANPLWTAQRNGDDLPAITVAVADDEDAQADGLATQIRSWQTAGVAPEQQAILCRTNRQAAQIAAKLERRGIAARHAGSLFERAEVKDLLAVLALASQPDGATLVRVAQMPNYAVPIEDATRFLTLARERNKPFPNALALIEDAEAVADLSPEGKQGLARLWRDLKPIIYRGNSWLLLSRWLFETSGYLRRILHSQESRSSGPRLAMYQLLSVLQGLCQSGTGASGNKGDQATGSDILHYFRALMACGEGKSLRLPAGLNRPGGVHILTAHAAKGLEFPVVYVPNLNKGQFPSRPAPGWITPLADWQDENAAERDEDGEEECLFFVALSRARDHLVLSRSGNDDHKPTTPSSLLERVEPILTACDAQRVVWQRQTPAVSTGEPSRIVTFSGVVSADISSEELTLFPPVALERPSVSLSALEQYRRCPRRYYYARVLHLPESGEESAYLTFYAALQSTLTWIQTECAQGGSLTEADALSQWAINSRTLRDEFGTAHAQLLDVRARTMIANACRTVSNTTSVIMETALTAQLENGNVTIRADRIERQDNNVLHVARVRPRKAKDDDHTDIRLALLRVAAQQTHPDAIVSIGVVTLGDGEAKTVKSAPRYEPARVAKYDDALAGIAQEKFPARPDERECARCPFLFLCPA